MWSSRKLEETVGDNSNEEARLKLNTFNEGEFGLPGGVGSSYGP